MGKFVEIGALVEKKIGDEAYEKIYSLIQAEIKNGSKDYDKNFIRNHVEKLTS